jgi:hypothetical protein
MTGILQAIFSFFGVTPSTSANYIEDVFSTYLYTGNSSTQTITNGIDLAGKGGMVWIKCRNTAATDNAVVDSVRGPQNILVPNRTNASSPNDAVDAFTSTGFSLTNDTEYVNANTQTYVSWTFREQAKFFDVVTYTGTGANRTIAHNLGSVPGFIIVKRTDTGAAWQCYHRSLANTEYMVLNTTAAKATGATRWNSTTPTSTVFSLGTATEVNASGGTYIAYLFAHDAGGFGLTGTDNVISCGSVTGGGTNAIIPVTLGYEPQFLIYKRVDATGAWTTQDVMRGWALTTNARLFPNDVAAESVTTDGGFPTSTGFTLDTTANATYIYIAIRRGPMKTPTTGTEVFGLSARTGTGANATVTGGTGSDDAVLIKNRGSAVGDLFASRLTGTGYLETSATTAEVAAGATILQANPWDVMDGVKVGTTSTITNASANTFINYLFRRAPGFMDVVCYTGTGANTTQTHNLGVAPELWMTKRRSSVADWQVGSTALANTEYLVLNSTAAKATSTARWNSTYPTSSVFSLGTASEGNTSGITYVAYLFATVTGVSKVGSYTGTAALQTVNCGFAAGARFVLVKATSTTGDWYVWDSARGISSSTDPYLLLNSTAAEVTSTNWVDTDSTGFKLTAASGNLANTNGTNYIFLAIS